MIQQAYKYVSFSFWPCLTFFKLKITNILKASGWGLEKSELPWEQKFLLREKCVVCAEGILTPNHKNLTKRFSSFSR